MCSQGSHCPPLYKLKPLRNGDTTIERVPKKLNSDNYIRGRFLYGLCPESVILSWQSASDPPPKKGPLRKSKLLKVVLNTRSSTNEFIITYKLSVLKNMIPITIIYHVYPIYYDLGIIIIFCPYLSR